MRVPDGVSLEDAGGIPEAGITSHDALFTLAADAAAPLEDEPGPRDSRADPRRYSRAALFGVVAARHYATNRTVWLLRSFDPAVGNVIIIRIVDDRGQTVHEERLRRRSRRVDAFSGGVGGGGGGDIYGGGDGGAGAGAPARRAG